MPLEMKGSSSGGTKGHGWGRLGYIETFMRELKKKSEENDMTNISEKWKMRNIEHKRELKHLYEYVGS